MINKEKLDKNHQLQESGISGIKVGKKDFNEAVQGLLRIDELAGWRDERVSFDAYR